MSNFSMGELSGLFDAVLKLKTKDECEKFFEDVCTIKELQDIAQRLQVAALLKAGLNYQEVSKETGASTATISRVNKCLVYGRGGYDIVLKNDKEQEDGNN